MANIMFCSVMVCLTVYLSFYPHQTMANKPKAVKGVDLARYMGRWYEIASFPSFFYRTNGENARANYILNNDGTVYVLNEVWNNGKREFMEGTAYKADPKSDEAKLKVKFNLPPLFPNFPPIEDYWILSIDQDYQYALIGGQTNLFLWILCRQTHLDDKIYNRLVEKAKEEGYDVTKLQKTPQSDPPPM